MNRENRLKHKESEHKVVITQYKLSTPLPPPSGLYSFSIVRQHQPNPHLHLVLA